MRFIEQESRLRKLYASLLHKTVRKGDWMVTICAYDKDGRFVGVRYAFGTNNNNYGQMWQSVFAGAPASGAITYTVSDTGAVSRTINAYGTTLASIFNDSAAGNLQTFIQLGTGSTAAARSDTNLQTAIAGTANVTGSYINGAASATLTASITYGSNQTPSEVGLFAKSQDNGGANAIRTYLLDHTVFSALPAATTFTVTYTHTLG